MKIFSKNIIFSIGVIITLLGILAKFRLADIKRKNDLFTNASNQFNDAFKDFLVMIETNFQYENGPINIPIPDHIAAANVFKQHLWWFKSKRFDRELAKYKQYAQEYHDIEKHVGLKNIPHQTSLQLEKQIKVLLKYAKPK